MLRFLSRSCSEGHLHWEMPSGERVVSRKKSSSPKSYSNNLGFSVAVSVSVAVAVSETLE